MQTATRGTWLGMAGLITMTGCASMQPTPKDMTFFVTSAGSGKGANLGGLDGADQHCQALAKAAGAGDRTWRAYLSTQAPALNDPNYVNARDRIGTGPWQNAKGVVVARSVDDLHSTSANITKDSALDEKGQPVKSRTDKPNEHDMLTGSRPDGTAFPGTPFFDMTCGNWTKGGKDGTAMVGHFDRAGPTASSWAMESARLLANETQLSMSNSMPRNLTSQDRPNRSNWKIVGAPMNPCRFPFLIVVAVVVVLDDCATRPINPERQQRLQRHGIQP